MKVGDFLKLSRIAGIFSPVHDNSGNVVGMSDRYGGAVLERRPSHKKDNFRVKRPNVLDSMDGCFDGKSAATSKGWISHQNAPALSIDYDDVRPISPAQCSLAVRCSNDFSSIYKDFGGPNGTSGIRPSDGVLLIPIKISDMPITAFGPPAVEKVCSFQITLCSDKNFDPASSAQLATSYLMGSSFFLRKGWNDLLINHLDDGTLNPLYVNTGTPEPGWKYSGTAAGHADTVYRFMRITIGGFSPTGLAAGAPVPVVKIGGIYQGGMAQPNIIIHCDDGQKDTLDLIRVFNSRMIPVTTCMITGNVGRGQFMDVTQLRALYDAGNDVISHTEFHLNNSIAAQTPEVLKAELGNSIGWLRNNRFPRTADSIAYPGNAYRDRDLAAVRAAGYTTGRGERAPFTSTIFGIDNALALGCRDMTKGTLAQSIKILDAAEAYGCTVIMMMHQIYYTPISSIVFTGIGKDVVGTATHENSTPIPVGEKIYIRGADNSIYNVASIVESSGPTSFTFRAPNVPAGTVNGGNSQVGGTLRFMSPTWPAAGGPPPAVSGTEPRKNSTYWYMSDFIAFANEIAKRWNNGTLTPINMATLMERCTLHYPS